ncbi:hypothetical protein LTR35_008566 [Friedmanniomyces endolithicus]|uniref:COP9 signalosome complex subunit 6 n=1 Tax=Friedmanniomyces endolithicus TaxID=329885 RepID=A0A4U0UNH7_9PEZI|nr:hypothetical protein LTS09_009879 [Friedmanniomyces endolithicus]KAK0279377.1 hypothetical protein LTR35_008566 [Friedmanniomyces endolithicus]KAK0287844.1 hypothetical protein LTS00_009689 [Friedmanniomyces endolithicus]KAK0310497.1 hypothetical protein LTR01_003649 [Friedmanniomyces endolithicus]KAK0320759.1 hypothetical protein LTR82_008077 [Friedmanniomyces endolithicus]
MAGKSASSNPLVLTGKAPDTTQHVQLHPLALLTISDYITRHTLRSQEGPIVGAVIGEQNGRSFTLEHAFECKLQELNGDVLVDGSWFAERLEQYRDVHKAPPLDLVAIFALGPVEGPQKVHLPMLKQVQQLTGNDSVMLLLFHGELVDQLQGGKLPISLYESVQEQEGAQTKFRELSFEVETGEAEMIGVDTVAKAGTAATAVQRADAAQAGGEASKKATGSKGKGKAKDKDKEDDTEAAGILSPEDDELIASLTAKANAIRMLNDRINLIRSYLTTLPPSYLTDATSTTPPPRDTTNHTLLRNVNSLLSRVPLLAPQSPTVALSNGHEAASATPSTAPAPPPPSLGIHAAGAKERQDVHLTSLLAVLSRSVAEAQTMGSKFHIVSREKENKSRPAFGGAGGRGGGGGSGGGGGGGRSLGGFGEEGLMGEVRGAP